LQTANRFNLFVEGTEDDLVLDYLAQHLIAGVNSTIV
jgi:hypothetical protein